MTRSRTIAEIEADLSALRAAAERAGVALGCLFSTSDEFEAAMRRARRVAQPQEQRSFGWPGAVEAIATAGLSIAFLLA